MIVLMMARTRYNPPLKMKLVSEEQKAHREERHIPCILGQSCPFLSNLASRSILLGPRCRTSDLTREKSAGMRVRGDSLHACAIYKEANKSVSRNQTEPRLLDTSDAEDEGARDAAYGLSPGGDGAAEYTDDVADAFRERMSASWRAGGSLLADRRRSRNEGSASSRSSDVCHLAHLDAPRRSGEP
jgi:hypothetical protein